MQLNKLHLNSVYADSTGLWFAGVSSRGMLLWNGQEVQMSVELPEGTHNAQPFRKGVIFNDTRSDCLRYATPDGDEDRKMDVQMFDKDQLESRGRDTSGVARQGFGRGLCVINESTVATGYSPSTIAVHDLRGNETVARVNLSMDVRNAIHGLEVWPYD